MLVVVILTKNEQIHISRCLQSAEKVSNKIIVVDSGSSDQTKSICNGFGVIFLEREWKNYSDQFNFGLQKAREIGARFVLRLDADEYMDDELVASINAIDFKNDEITGYYFKRHITFLGKLIRFGGVTPISVIRLFQADLGKCEERWMDEHIVVSGVTKKLRGKLVDDSRKDMNWWINKHLWYAERESIDILTSSHRGGGELNAGNNKAKRIIKAMVYNKLPLGVRPALYFCYRYFFRLGFADGFKGFLFHFLQGFWYRTMVDFKVFQVQEKVRSEGISLQSAIRELYGFDIDA